MSAETGGRAHRFRVGAFACAVISDGTFAYENPAAFFATAPPSARDLALRAYGIDVEAWHEYVSPYSALLMDTGQQQVPVDTGAGDFAPSNGQLLQNLHAESVDPVSIDTVIRQAQSFRCEPIQ